MDSEIMQTSMSGKAKPSMITLRQETPKLRTDILQPEQSCGGGFALPIAIIVTVSVVLGKAAAVDIALLLGLREFCPALLSKGGI